MGERLSSVLDLLSLSSLMSVAILDRQLAIREMYLEFWGVFL